MPFYVPSVLKISEVHIKITFPADSNFWTRVWPLKLLTRQLRVKNHLSFFSCNIQVFNKFAIWLFVATLSCRVCKLFPCKLLSIYLHWVTGFSQLPYVMHSYVLFARYWGFCFGSWCRTETFKLKLELPQPCARKSFLYSKWYRDGSKSHSMKE